MEIFTFLKLPTGYNYSDIKEVFNHSSHAGMEIANNIPALEEACKTKSINIFKAPAFALNLQDLLIDKRIKFVLIPIRNNSKAAESRSFQSPDRGGFWANCTNIKCQERFNNYILSNIMYVSTFSEVKTLTTSFPRFVFDPDYSYRRLSKFFIYYNISKTDYVKAHKAIVHPNFIHS